MNAKFSSAMLLPLLFLAGCEEETAPETVTPANAGQVSGEVLGGTISDDMLPLEELTSTSPPAEPTVTTTQTTRADGGQTTVETTVETTTGEEGPPPPAPPEQPAAPEEAAPEE